MNYLTMVRRKGREIALQVLYQMELGQIPPQKALEHYQKYFIHNKNEDEFVLSRGEEELEQAFAFAKDLVLGIEQNKKFIDNKIKRYAKNWPFNRLNLTDKNLLRIAIFEMFFRPDIPEVVSINEAVELAKLYGVDESPSFVNGVLDSIYKKELPGEKRQD